MREQNFRGPGERSLENKIENQLENRLEKKNYDTKKPIHFWVYAAAIATTITIGAYTSSYYYNKNIDPNRIESVTSVPSMISIPIDMRELESLEATLINSDNILDIIAKDKQNNTYYVLLVNSDGTYEKCPAVAKKNGLEYITKVDGINHRDFVPVNLKSDK